MLNDLHVAIEHLLYEHGGLDALDVDIVFAAPVLERIQRLTRPTVSFFLYELTENVDLRQNSFQSVRENGHSERRLPPRRVDLRYLVSVHTSDPVDEYTLIWKVLATLMKNHELPDEVLSEELHRAGVPIVTRTAQPDDITGLAETQRGLDLQSRSCVVYVVTAPLDLDVVIRSPLVLTSSTRFQQAFTDDPFETTRRIGGVVRGDSGDPIPGAVISVRGRIGSGCTTDERGRFVLNNVDEGEVLVQIALEDGTTEEVVLSVPSSTYDIELEQA